ncbi:hypothetical protein [Bradyrhizobium sp. th.b2]|uniref:hypothetical protein n=1 Tax=Bradyrhizobium sp. th-b2 TaxID=172088 RepID=UPI0012EC7898|nr:hypothetical protein [Bradyrhizobium sp. th.b2]
MADLTAPQLTGLTLPSILDISSGPVSATFGATATDDQSGVKQVVIWLSKQFTDNVGTFSLIGLFGFGADTWADGASQDTRTVSQFNGPGTYEVSSVVVSDMMGNPHTYTPQELTSLGFSTSFAIYNQDYQPSDGADLLSGSNLEDHLSRPTW